MDSSALTSLILTTVTGIAVGALMLRYLGLKTTLSDDISKHTLERVQSASVLLRHEIGEQLESVKTLSEEVAQLRKRDLNQTDREELAKAIRLQLELASTPEVIRDIQSRVDSLQETIVKTAASVRDALQAEMRETFNAQSKSAELDSLQGRLTKRLYGEMEALGRRGNVNLIIGVAFTVVAVAILATLAWSLPPTEADRVKIFLHYVPRTTLAAFVELFSFFFLKMYRSALADIKYYHNELTNIESQFTALRAGFMLGDNTASTEVMERLARTERNFILEKGQSTVQLANAQLGEQVSNQVVTALMSALSRNGSERQTEK